LRRPGRFDKEFHIGIPNSDGRYDILNTILFKVPHSLSIQDLEEISSVTHGYVGADLAQLCKEASLKAIKRYNGKFDSVNLKKEDFIASFPEITPSAMREVE
jgi:SpoVK/Ycf46/Vps4 family AAA+-type ATPase